MHCINGVTYMDPLWEEKATPSRWFGEAGTGQATRTAVRSEVILNPTVADPWLLAEINSSGYELQVRSLGSRPMVGR